MGRLRGRIMMLSSLLAAAGLVAAVAGSGSAAQAGHATTAASAPSIVVRDFRFLGFDKDVVGRGWDAKPNGERDAHFSVVLATPKGARSWGGDLLLLRCPPGSEPSPDRPGVDTQKRGVPFGKCEPGDFPDGFASNRPGVPVFNGSGFSERDTKAVLAVFRNGKRLKINPHNPTTWLRLPRSAKGVRLDLYVNDGPRCIFIRPSAPMTAADECVRNKRIDHRFAAGQVFRLMIQNAADRSYSAWLTLPGQVTTPSTAIVLSNFSFHGLDKDVLGPTPGSPPDGKPDGHFSIEITTPTGPIDLQDVQLRSWSVSSGMLAVFVGDTRLKLEASNLGQGCPPRCITDPQNTLDLRWSTKPVRLDLYAPDDTWGPFAPGQRWRATIRDSGVLVAQSDWLTLPSG